MKCPECQSENPDDTRFCGNCASPLTSSEKETIVHTETLQTPMKEITTGSTFAGRYQVIEELGKGGMGKVYKAFDTEIKEKVALKLVKPEVAADEKTIERFRNELKYTRKIGHRNVCKMYDLSKAEGTYFITMEYVSGEDLKSFIRRSGQLTVTKAVSLAKQVCEGLSEAHRLGVVHRDLKPGNIMIDKEGNARIMDFGIARSLKAKGMTDEGVMIGTPEYMSPEQAVSEDVDQRSDIYSLGVILFEMLTGRVPFGGETPLGIAMKHKTEKPPNPREFNPHIPDDLNQLILKCMEKDKERRFQSAAEVLEGISDIERGFPSTETVIPTRKPQTSKEITVTIGLKKALFPVVAVIAIVALAFIIWRTIPRGQSLPVPSDKPSLAVMYFKNNTGDENLDHWRSALADLLITDLSQSKYIKVLSGERLFNILSQLNQLEATSYSSDVLKDVAARGGVSNVLVGNFTRADGVFRINVTLQDARTGELVGSESVEGIGEKSFYAMVDELTKKVKENFQFSEQEIAADIDREVEAITTSSPEAYKLYSEARRYHLVGDYPKSVTVMQKAVEIDPEFAMAHRSMSSSYGNMGYRPARKNSIQKAFELSYRVSERERYLIAGDFYRTSEKTYDKAIEAFKELLALYPDDTIANTNLGITYYELEEWDKAIRLLNTNIQNDYEGWLSHWNLTEVYMAMGSYDKARETIENCVIKFPDDSRFPSRLAEISICQGKYELAMDELEKALFLDSERQGFVTKKRGDIFLLKGDLEKAEKEYLIFQRGIPISRMSLAILYLSQGKFEDTINEMKLKPIFHEPLAFAYLKSGKPEEALDEFSTVLSDAVKAESVSWQIRILHSKGLAYLQLKSLNDAQNTADEIEEIVQRGLNKKAIRYYYHLMGMIELENENYSKGIDFFRRAISLLPSPVDPKIYYHPLFIDSLARTYYKTGNLEMAQREFEKIISLTLARLDNGDIYAKSIYMLGKIHQERGRKERAIEQYEKFLDFWKDADSDMLEVTDAERQLAVLKR